MKTLNDSLGNLYKISAVLDRLRENCNDDSDENLFTMLLIADDLLKDAILPVDVAVAQQSPFTNQKETHMIGIKNEEDVFVGLQRIKALSMAIVNLDTCDTEERHSLAFMIEELSEDMIKALETQIWPDYKRPEDSKVQSH